LKKRVIRQAKVPFLDGFNQPRSPTVTRGILFMYVN
jgi:hypothetical protein